MTLFFAICDRALPPSAEVAGTRTKTVVNCDSCCASFRSMIRTGVGESLGIALGVSAASSCEVESFTMAPISPPPSVPFKQREELLIKTTCPGCVSSSSYIEADHRLPPGLGRLKTWPSRSVAPKTSAVHPSSEIAAQCRSQPPRPSLQRGRRRAENHFQVELQMQVAYYRYWEIFLVNFTKVETAMDALSCLS